MRVSSKVPAQFKQTAVLDYLTTRFTYRSREEWADLLAEGRVRGNGRILTPDDAITQGDVIACDLPDTTPPPANFDYQIIYEDEWLLGINKPADLRVHAKRRYAQANLIYHLRRLRQPPYPEATLINRLDKDTSGIILIARDGETLRLMQQLFREKAVAKEYLAVVHGVPDPPAGTIDQPIGRMDSLPGVYRYGVTAEGKTAVTRYETKQTFTIRNTQYAILKLQPQTGRTHQLRVHLTALGHPIVGDRLYAMSDAAYLDWCAHKTPHPLIQRQALHSAAVQFIHPRTQQPLCLTAPLPADIQSLISDLQSPQ
ncbi:MAG TPA: RluA family pseudouridine synthase [Chloroflexi bacterium]|nr:RluA family pseudouridine synthase [Chloroflexota bacterium]